MAVAPPVNASNSSVVVAASRGAWAQGEGWYDFELPWFDSLPSAVDVSWLNERPAGLHGKLGVSAEGHFVFEDGTPVRFLGTSVSWGWGMPSKTDAEILAGRLAKAGFNLLRFHKIETLYRPDYSIFDLTLEDTRHLDPIKVDRLDYFIYQLKEHGIYVDMNLHAERFFLRGDGMADWEQLPVDAKYVTLFNDTAIDLQKEYASGILAHVNPYTGLRLADDPVLAMIEITNENSLFLGDSFDALYGLGEPRGPLNGSHELPPRYVQELDDRWNVWLQNTYSDRPTLNATWGEGAMPPSGPNLVVNGNFSTSLDDWVFYAEPTEQAAVTNDAVVYQGAPAAARVDIQLSTGTGYSNIRFSQNDTPLAANTTYTLSFWAKASRTLCLQVDAWGGFTYLGEDFTISKAWRQYLFTFRTQTAGPATFRFNLGRDQLHNVQFWLDTVDLRAGGIRGLQAFEDPWSGTVVRVPFSELESYTAPRMGDQTRFYVDVETHYFAEMYAQLRALGVTIPVTGTNAFYGPAGLLSQAALSYTDQHCYWDPAYIYSGAHRYDFPMVNDTGDGTIPWVMASAVAGKPATISEYNHYSTQPTCVEGPMFLGAYAAFQDLDAIMFFGIHGDPPLGIRYLTSPFDIDTNPLYMGLFPFVALMYRRGDISVATTTAYYTFNESLSLQTYLDAGIMCHFAPYELNHTPLEHKVRKLLIPDVTTPTQQRLDNQVEDLQQCDAPLTEMRSSKAASTVDNGLEPVWITSDTGELQWAPTAGVFLVNTTRTQGAVGYFSEVQLPVLGISSSTDFTAFLATALDGQPLHSSRHILIFAGSQVRNTDWVLGDTPWAENWGRPPTQLRPVQATIRLTLASLTASAQVFALDPIGRRSHAIAFNQLADHILSFDSGSEGVWYEVVLDPLPVAVIDQATPVPMWTTANLALRGHAERVSGSTSSYWWEIYPATNRSYVPTRTARTSAFVTELPRDVYLVRFLVCNDETHVWSDPSEVLVQILLPPELIAFPLTVCLGLVLAAIAVIIYRRTRHRRLPSLPRRLRVNVFALENRHFS
jgi:hypothetical protein